MAPFAVVDRMVQIRFGSSLSVGRKIAVRDVGSPRGTIGPTGQDSARGKVGEVHHSMPRSAVRQELVELLGFVALGTPGGFAAVSAARPPRRGPSIPTG